MLCVVGILLHTRRHRVNNTILKSYNKLISNLRGPMEGLSGLARIVVKDKDPFVLFNEWREEAKNFSTGPSNVFCLATTSRDGKTSARHLVLRRLENDGFVMMSDRRSRKAQDLRDVPSAAMCILWAYKKDSGEHVSRQVRMEGDVRELKREEYQDLYEKEPLYCKIRTHICNQDSKIDWNELKSAHDELFQKIKNGEADLPMPEHAIGYKLTPSLVEFYHAQDHLIADRIEFSKDTQTGDWNHEHIAA